MVLKTIYNSILPGRNYTALTIFPFIFVREGNRHRFNDVAERHECTHAWQQIECLWLLFFLLYGIEWMFKWLACRFDSHRAYRSVSFEQEAYGHQNESDYNKTRKHYVWIRYIFKLT